MTTKKNKKILGKVNKFNTIFEILFLVLTHKQSTDVSLFEILLDYGISLNFDLLVRKIVVIHFSFGWVGILWRGMKCEWIWFWAIGCKCSPAISSTFFCPFFLLLSSFWARNKSLKRRREFFSIYVSQKWWYFVYSWFVYHPSLEKAILFHSFINFSITEYKTLFLFLLLLRLVNILANSKLTCILLTAASTWHTTYSTILTKPKDFF